MSPNSCYHPTLFAPGGESLFDLKTWQQVASALAAVTALPAAAAVSQFPDPRVAKVFKTLSAAVKGFLDETMPKVAQMSQAAYNYSELSVQSFNAIGQIMSEMSDTDPQKKKRALVDIFQNLISEADRPRVAAEAAYESVIVFAELVEKETAELKTVLGADSNPNSGDIGAQSAALTAAIAALNSLEGSLSSALESLKKIVGAWDAIKAEEEEVLATIQTSDPQNLDQNPCLSPSALGTAGSEWAAVGRSANEFTIKFMELKWPSGRS